MSQTPQRIGEYTVVRLLGMGGMGAVYLAEDARLGRKAAVKTMRPDLAADPAGRARFLREARAAARVEHDYVVPVWGVGEAADGTPYIAMPFLAGESLESRLRREPVSPAALVLKAARELAEGLAAAHAAGLVHRDIKPANVWAEGDPASPEPGARVRRFKLLDFGLARSTDGGGEESGLTASGAVLGTPAYMAPEQARGETVDGRADLFSLGVVLYRMATGVSPFAGPTAMASLTALATATPAPADALNPGLPPGLGGLIDRLIRKSVAERPGSAAEVAAEAARLSRGPDTPVSLWVPPAAPVSRQPAADPWDLDGPTADAPPTPRPAAKSPSAAVLVGRLAASAALTALALWLSGVFRAAPVPTGTEGKPAAPAAKPKPVPRPPDPERRSAEAVLAAGGAVRLGDGTDWVAGAVGLPREAFRVTGVRLDSFARSPDAALAAVVGRDLISMELTNATLTDDALSRLAGLERVRELSLRGAGRVGDAGVAAFARCGALERLTLSGTRVTDAGLSGLPALPSLVWLELQQVGLTDAGLARFRDSTRLEHVALDNTPVGDAGVAHLAGCGRIKLLGLQNTRVGDEGLKVIRGMPLLAVLGLTGTGVGDAGLETLRARPTLRHVTLTGTRVTAARVRDLAAALPACKIEWDGGVLNAPK